MRPKIHSVSLKSTAMKNGKLHKKEMLEYHEMVAFNDCSLHSSVMLECQQVQWNDESWNKTSNPEPWNKLDPTYQYKFVAITTDYKNLKKDGPEF
ncbi:NADH dehydrogenase [ubiquinone] 1 alpha subcomplex subunit 4-like 2 [Oryzias melastigma]|uniref:NADH dehydrogenase [ubiquinone] 1 alpha subcomplex subunit 4-like 2 n=1 Tax=Oryzias melastigma TaxID=30732 RepID=A0A834KW94_ORYME|nr:NADH dehydrogenase [ubiquinone] 1 alpha subcomplex subunit 4-like 2 [Oryzias melastigma]